jgi:hypothetical protein
MDRLLPVPGLHALQGDLPQWGHRGTGAALQWRSSEGMVKEIDSDCLKIVEREEFHA